MFADTQGKEEGKHNQEIKRIYKKGVTWCQQKIGDNYGFILKYYSYFKVVLTGVIELQCFYSAFIIFSWQRKGTYYFLIIYIRYYVSSLLIFLCILKMAISVFHLCVICSHIFKHLVSSCWRCLGKIKESLRSRAPTQEW